jgi:hypothetical protein
MIVGMQTVELPCAECGRLDDGERGWQAHFVPADEGPEDELVVRCPEYGR